MVYICYFQDQVLGFMQDVFSFDQVHFAQLPLLADDILRLSQERLATTQEFISRVNV